MFPSHILVGRRPVKPRASITVSPNPGLPEPEIPPPFSQPAAPPLPPNRLGHFCAELATSQPGALPATRAQAQRVTSVPLAWVTRLASAPCDRLGRLLGLLPLPQPHSCRFLVLLSQHQLCLANRVSLLFSVTLLSQPGSALPPPQPHKDIPHPSRKRSYLLFSFLPWLAGAEHVVLPPGHLAVNTIVSPRPANRSGLAGQLALLVNSFPAKLGLVSYCSQRPNTAT